MAIVDRDSTGITNLNASPLVRNNSNAEGTGEMREAIGYVANAADDSATSVHRFCRVPSNARISQVLFHTLLSVTGGAVDIGVYDTDEDGTGAVVDADLFASALVITTPDKLNLDVTFESGQYTVAETVKPLWEVLGATEDPMKDYDIATTITTDFNGAIVGQTLKVRYSI